MILITGATGHIGNVLTKQLKEKDAAEEIRVLLLPQEDYSCLDGLGLEIVRGDIRSYEDVLSAVQGCDKVFHLAGMIDIGRKGLSSLYDVNVGGTRNVVDACLACGVKRLVYVSSVHALPEPPRGQLIRESEDFPCSGLLGHYALSKSQATAEVYRGIRSGLDAVIIFPTGIIGPDDYKFSELGRVLLYGLQRPRRVMFGFQGEYDFVDVRDVASGLIAAMERGKAGEGYLLSGHRISVSDLFRTVQGTMGCHPRMLNIPAFLIRLAAPFSEFFGSLFRQRPLLTPYSFAVLQSNCLVDGSKAARDLGYHPRPAEVTLLESTEWMKQYTRILKEKALEKMAQQSAAKKREQNAVIAANAAARAAKEAGAASARAEKAAAKAALAAQKAAAVAEKARECAVLAAEKAQEYAALSPSLPKKSGRVRRWRGRKKVAQPIQ